jgi:hypothetical protein
LYGAPRAASTRTSVIGTPKWSSSWGHATPIHASEKEPKMSKVHKKMEKPKKHKKNGKATSFARLPEKGIFDSETVCIYRQTEKQVTRTDKKSVGQTKKSHKCATMRQKMRKNAKKCEKMRTWKFSLYIKKLSSFII